MSAFTIDLARSPESAGTARRLVDERTTALGSQQRDDAALMVCELVTNALVHGTGTISLRIDVEPGSVRVEVSDQGEVALAPSPTPGSPTTGVSSTAARGSGSDSRVTAQHARSSVSAEGRWSAAWSTCMVSNTGSSRYG